MHPFCVWIVSFLWNEYTFIKAITDASPSQRHNIMVLNSWMFFFIKLDLLNPTFHAICLLQWEPFLSLSQQICPPKRSSDWVLSISYGIPSVFFFFYDFLVLDIHILYQLFSTLAVLLLLFLVAYDIPIAFCWGCEFMAEHVFYTYACESESRIRRIFYRKL